jgi:hypothetical protein
VYTVKDVQGNLVFHVENPGWTANHTLYDESGLPLALLKKRLWRSSRWAVYRGTKKNGANELFTYRYCLFFCQSNFCEVFLPGNTNINSSPDFVMERETAFMRGTKYTVV